MRIENTLITLHDTQRKIGTQWKTVKTPTIGIWSETWDFNMHTWKDYTRKYKSYTFKGYITTRYITKPSPDGRQRATFDVIELRQLTAEIWNGQEEYRKKFLLKELGLTLDELRQILVK